MACYTFCAVLLYSSALQQLSANGSIAAAAVESTIASAGVVGVRAVGRTALGTTSMSDTVLLTITPLSLQDVLSVPDDNSASSSTGT
jgi:hypothetical protein